VGGNKSPDDLGQIGSSLTRTIGSTQLPALLTSIGDSAFGAFVPWDVLRDIPVFGMLYEAAKVTRDIKEALFVRKVFRFLDPLAATSDEERMRFVERLEAKGKVEEFGETIFLLLERIDDTVKPGIIGRIGAALVRGDVSYDKAMRLAAIVNRCYAQDLEYLRRFPEGAHADMADTAASLFSVGLLRQTGQNYGSMSAPISSPNVYELNEYGRLLLEYGLD
jgi:hypothetical protein